MTLGALLVRFLLAAVIVIAAGTVLARAGDVVAARTRLGGAWVGSVFLALATSLPEIVTDIAAVRLGAIDLAVGDLMGSSMANMLILALISLAPAGVDMFRRAAFDHALYACLAIIMTILAAMGLVTRVGSSVAGIGTWSLLLVVTYAVTSSLAFRVSQVTQTAGEVTEMSGAESTGSHEGRAEGAPSSHAHPMSLRRAIWSFLGAALVIVVVAPQFAKAAEGLAVVSGLGHTFMGTWLVGLSTSLPELVTSMAAVRLRAYDLAVGNLFGSNAINMTIFAILDPFHPQPMFAVASADHILTALAAVVLMTIALGTLVLRSRRAAAREPGSILLVVGYVAGIALAYWRSVTPT
jgi:cation:H+ antiporter